MKRIKKISATLLTFTMLASLAGCGSTNTQSGNNSGQADTKPAAESQAAAVDYPTEAIRVIVPYAAGGNTDLNARAVANIVQEKKLLNESMVVSNITGANTMNGCSTVVDAEPNAQTLLCHHTALVGINASGGGEIMYNDMKPVIEIATAPFCIVASKDSGFTNVDEIVEYANAHPGELKMAYIGAGSTTHLTAMLFLSNAGISDKVTTVSYTSGADALTAQLSGEVQLRASVGPDAARYITSGDLTCICVSSADAAAVWEGYPTWSDLGWNVNFYMSQGFYTTKDSPESSVKILTDAVTAACQTEEYAAFCEENGMSPSWLAGDEWTAKLDELYDICKESFDSGILD